MAGGAIIGALRVVFGADTSSLEKGAKSAQSSMTQWSNSMKISGAVITGVMAGIIGGVAAGVKQTVDSADKLGKSAQSIGLPVEELSKLKFAAELSDVSMESLTVSMGRLNKNMTAVAGGAKGPAAEAFRALGISVKNTDGSLKSSSQVLSEVSDKFAGYQDGAAKSALAIAIFGKAGADMIPMLNEGSAGLKKAADEATRFGLVITHDMAQGAQNFNDNMTRIKGVLGGLLIQLTGHMVPALENLSVRLLASASDGEAMKTFAENLSTALVWLVSKIEIVAARIQSLAAIWAAFQQIWNANIFSEEWSAGFTKLTAAMDASDNKVREITASYKKSIADIATATNSPFNEMFSSFNRMHSELDVLMRDFGKAPPPILATGEAAKKLADEAKKAAETLKTWQEGHAKTVSDLQIEADSMGMTAAVAAKYKFEMQELAEAVQKKIALTPELLASIAATGDKIAALTTRIEENKEATKLGNQMLDATTNALTDIAMGTKEPMEAFKELAKSIIRDIVAMTIKAIILKTILSSIGGVGGLGGLFTGMLGIGAAEGGSFTVPGGSSATDNTPVLMNLAAGERVDIRSTQNDGMNDRAPTTAVINIPNRSDREFVRPIAETLRGMISDGFQLVDIKVTG